LASYVSMQLVPTFTESGGHLSVPARAGAAATRHTTVQPMTTYLRTPGMVSPTFPPRSGFPELGRRASGIRSDSPSRALREGGGECTRVTYLTVNLYFCLPHAVHRSVPLPTRSDTSPRLEIPFVPRQGCA